ncbi:MAG: dienelactone hydrolase family protein [Planctomycetes bacterium]|nr:dienelactone hydrolase family protein [Planctomycetota bacterium]
MIAYAIALSLSSCLAQDPAPIEPAPAKTGDTGLTGALSEDEFMKLHELKPDEQGERRGLTVTLESGANGYLVLPKGADPTKRPLSAVLVIHEWWGLNRNIELWCDRLAETGVAALAVDLYGGVVATTSDEAMKAMRAVDTAKAVEHLKSAYAFLTTDERVKAVKVGSIGWCFGGAMSLQTALNVPELDACVLYYGRLVTDPKVLGSIRCPVLGVFGTKDGSIPPATVKQFDDALTEAKVVHEIHSYEAEHAFANPSSPRYDHEHAAAAWEKVKAFLDANLKTEPAPPSK